MRIEDIQRVLVVGAGTMGQEIALQCACYGYPVNLYDIAGEALAAAAARQKSILARLVAEGRLSPVQAEAALNRLCLTLDPDQAGRAADLLGEAVPEEPALKAEVLARFGEICPPHAIFTTNSSYLLPSILAEATGRPGQFATFRFHHEVWVSNVVNIVPHPGTSEEIVELLYAFARRIGQIPIVCRPE